MNLTSQWGDEVPGEDRPLRFVRVNKEQADHLIVDARASPRYAISQAIRFTRKGHVPAPASLVNLSEGGALARMRGNAFGGAIALPWPLRLRPGDELWMAWPLRLRPGDELWMVDLIELPLPCWLIEAGVGLIRVHIYHDDMTRTPLRALIARLAAACQQQHVEARPMSAEQQPTRMTNRRSDEAWMI
jgi:hypothetical protein